MLFEVSLEVVHDFTTSRSAGSTESQQNGNIYFTCFLLFSTIIASSQHLRGGLWYLRTGGHPHRPLQLWLQQIKVGFRSHNSLFTFDRGCQNDSLQNAVCHQPTFSLHMTHAIVSTSRVYVCVTMKQITQDVYTHGDMFVCFCCGFGRNVSDPALFTTVRQQHVFSETFQPNSFTIKLSNRKKNKPERLLQYQRSCG